MSSPVSQPWPFAARLRGWHNLRLPIKLAFVTLVPMIAMITLGVVLIGGRLGTAAQYSRADLIARLSASVRASITVLQDEREQVAGAAAMPGATPEALDPARHATDSALAATRYGVAADTAAGDLDPVAEAAWSGADRQLGALASLRAARADGATEVASYTDLVNALFAFDRVLTTGLADARLTRQALSLYDLFAARDEVRYEQSVVLAGIGRHTMSVADVTSLHGSEARLASRISDFRAVASDDVARDYDREVDAAALARQNMLLGQAIDQSGGMTRQVMPGMSITVAAGTWNAANRSVTTGLDKVTNGLADSLQSAARSLWSGATGMAGVAIVVLLIALAVTIVLGVLVARQLVRSIDVLRRTARDVATRQLPDAVERIRAGETVDATVAPVGVPTADEVGQLARAFDAVHGEALRLAVEQATTRANYGELFVNLSRRSQSLVQRQLRLIEQLERDEEDPEQLSALFELDHLATRMRRNNENLLVLSGGELSRSTGQQVALADLVRAAVSEIEHYQRVVVQPPPDAHVVGYAAGDLVRLIAELLDNATAFSSPDTHVTVASHRTRRKAIVIDIVDHGIGMTDEELIRANEQLSHPAGVEGRISRRMGLFVISRLAHEHGVRVRLHGGQDIPGLRVTITVPADLVITEPEPEPLPANVLPGGGPGNDVLGGPLPKRTAGATTAANGAWHGTLRGILDGASPSPDPVPTAMTVTIPALPSAEASGAELFKSLSEEDSAVLGQAPDGGEAVTAPEVTPIYDTMVSAWFEEALPAAQPMRRRPDEDAWRFAADEGWQAVGAAADAEPTEFTPAGLPRRQPKALLLPGSVRQQQATRTGRPRSADDLRHRLSGLQDGVRRGRSAGQETATGTGQSEKPVTGAASDWTSSADEGWRAVDAMPEPGELTAAGLPRRRPMAHLLPGSVAPDADAAPPRRDAGAMRERLHSFQRGVSEGRGAPAYPAQTPVEHGFHWQNWENE